MTAPRIDTVRRIGNGVVHRLAGALANLDDLHAIGWYRHADLRARQRVTGGDPTAVGIDLDNHGNPQARAAYEHLAHALLTAGDQLGKAIDETNEIFDLGLIQARRDQTADATSAEVVAALGALEKRQLEGQTTSTPVTAQPMPTGSRRYLDTVRLTEELEALQNAVRKTGQRPDRSRLTPRELTAWNNATGSNSRRKAKR